MVKADSKGRPIVNPDPVTIAEEKSSYVPSSNPTPTRELTSEEREERRLRRIAEEAELERQRKGNRSKRETNKKSQNFSNM